MARRLETGVLAIQIRVVVQQLALLRRSLGADRHHVGAGRPAEHVD